MNVHRRTAAASLLILVLATAMTACAPSPSTNLNHLTIWQGEVTYPNTEPDIVSWIGYGSFAYNTGPGCDILEGGSGWTQAFTRLDDTTVRVTITLDWLEGNNSGAGYGCGVHDIHAGLRDAGGTEVAFAVLPVISHT